MAADELHVLHVAHVPHVLPSPLCVITDRHRSANVLPAVLQMAVRGGARWIRVREPDLELSAYASLCHLLIRAVDDARVTWSVRPSAYLLLRSAWPELRLGVHLTSHDAPWRAGDHDILLGRSVHVDDGVHAGPDERSATIVTRNAAPPAGRDEQLDYQLLAPVFRTACKPDAQPTGVAAITRFVRASDTPVIALGGVTPHNVADCLMAGASGIAVCGGVMESDTPENMAAAYLRKLANFADKQ